MFAYFQSSSIADKELVYAWQGYFKLWMDVGSLEGTIEAQELLQVQSRATLGSWVLSKLCKCTHMRTAKGVNQILHNIPCRQNSCTEKGFN